MCAKIARIIQRAGNDTFLRHNSIYFFGMLAFGVLNYLYYPVLGHLLHTVVFGELQLMTSLFLQALIFLTVLGLVTVNIVTNYENETQRNTVISELERLAFFGGVLLLAIAVACGPVLRHFFQVSSAWPFVLLALVIAVTIPFTFRNAYLRGRQLFGLSSVANILASALQLILSALLVLLGFGLNGAMLGLVLGVVGGFVFSAIQARRHGFHESFLIDVWRLPDLRRIMPELKYAGAVLLGSLAITMLYSIDSLASKHWLDPHTAGLYAGIATVGRVIFFVTASVSQVMLASVRLRKRASENRQLLGKSALLVIGIGGGIAGVFALVPTRIIQLLMGASFMPLAYLLPRLCLVMFITSLINLLVLYFLALRRTSIVLIVILGMLGAFVWIFRNHGTPAAIVDSLLFGSVLTLGLIGLWVGMLGYKLSIKGADG